MTKGTLIAFSGAHGTGKTTMVLNEASIIKKNDPSLSVYVIQETARNCPYPVLTYDTHACEAAQEWIFAEQMRRETEALWKNDIVVTDRTLYDVVAYTMQAGFNRLAQAMVSMLNVIGSRYDEIHFVRVKDTTVVCSDRFRNTDTGTVWEIDGILENLYNGNSNVRHR